MAPASTNPRAIISPMPLVPPVTRTVLPETSNSEVIGEVYAMRSPHHIPCSAVGAAHGVELVADAKVGNRLRRDAQLRRRGVLRVNGPHAGRGEVEPALRLGLLNGLEGAHEVIDTRTNRRHRHHANEATGVFWKHVG